MERAKPRSADESEGQFVEKSGNQNCWDAGDVWKQRLWVGSLAAVRDTAALSAHGITSVLTVAARLRVWASNEEHDEGSPARPLRIKHHATIEIADHPCADLLEVLPSAVDFLDAHLLGNSNGGVLVHCASGVSRSVATCVAWLLTRQGLSLEQALAHVRCGRPLGNPNAGFALQLQALERHSGNVSGARADYQAQIAAKGAGSVQEVLFEQRERANAFHARADGLEEAIKSATGGPISGECALKQLRELQHEVDASLLEFVNGAVQDRPARMITKSAASKVARLLADLEGECETLARSVDV